ncbi:MAG: DUF3293 domain-containing protein [Luteimonas sp.]
MANPDDPAALAAAFARAHYVVPTLGDAGGLHVGTQASALEERLPAARYAFITAWNSNSETEAQADNLRADGELTADLDGLRVPRLRAHAQDAQGGHREDGWLVRDLPLAALDRLARHYGQDGVLAWSAGEPVRLRLYHTEPADASRLLWVDWVG